LVSRLDLRTAAEEKESRKLLTTLTDHFRKVGREDLARLLQYDLPRAIAARGDQDGLIPFAGARLAEIGWPGAVFILPPNVVLTRRLTLAYGNWSY